MNHEKIKKFFELQCTFFSTVAVHSLAIT